MLLDMSVAFEDDVESVQVYSFGVGTRVKGHWVSSPNPSDTIEAAVYPASAEDVNELYPTGDKALSYKKFYSAYLFQVADESAGIEADEVVAGEERFKIVAVADWEDQAGYRRALGVRIS